jgi:hypothetical protein
MISDDLVFEQRRCWNEQRQKRKQFLSGAERPYVMCSSGMFRLFC